MDARRRSQPQLAAHGPEPLDDVRDVLIERNAQFRRALLQLVSRGTCLAKPLSRILLGDRTGVDLVQGCGSAGRR